jgi:signal transduction histidine kinase/ActR/RegA family two-component response regulator
LAKENLIAYGVEKFEQNFQSDALVSIVSPLLENIASGSTLIEEKELIDLYKHLSNIDYATNLESFLLTYYVTKKEAVAIENTIFWDKIIQTSDLLNVEDILNHSSIGKSLEKTINSDTFTRLSQKIDEMRITILTQQMDVESEKNLDWIILLEDKLRSLESMETEVYQTLYSKVEDHVNDNFWAFLFYLMITLLSIAALLITYRQIKKEMEENKALLDLVNKIYALSSFEAHESDVMLKMLEEAEYKKDIFKYLDSSYKVLHEKHKQARDEVVSKSQFLSTLSHEIRTPLNGIIGFSKLLKEMGTTPDQEEFLSLVENSSNKLIMIVNDILDLSKINAQKMVIERKSFDIFEVVESTVASFTQQTDHKDIELGLFIDPFLQHHFFGDPTKLTQILTNLIGNAVKFTDPYGKINVFVQMITQDNEKSKIKFAVNDDGIGLSKEQMKNIFSPFAQASNSTSSKYGGTGLGLTISHDMVGLMGGTLEVKSELNFGATFFFTLELQKDKEYVDEPHPNFSGVTVGMALPVRSIKRQLDSNLENYIRHLNAEFKYYYYDELFEDDVYIELPDIMIFDHHYARLAGELEQCASIDCKTILLTNGALSSRINPERHHFTKVLYRPVTLAKSIRILNVHNEEIDITPKPSKELKNVDSFKGLKALVADDNPVNRKLVKIILEKIGLDVTLASDGQEVFDAYREDRYDIIFMDIQMPDMDGIEATHAILAYEKDKKLPHVPIIALTANVGVGDKERYIAEGMDDYATKPLEIDTIKMLISKYANSEVSS